MIHPALIDGYVGTARVILRAIDQQPLFVRKFVTDYSNVSTVSNTQQEQDRVVVGMRNLLDFWTEDFMPMKDQWKVEDRIEYDFDIIFRTERRMTFVGDIKDLEAECRKRIAEYPHA